MPLGNLLAADELANLVRIATRSIRSFRGISFVPHTTHLLYRSARIEMHMIIGPQPLGPLSEVAIRHTVQLLVRELVPNHEATSAAWLSMNDGTALGLRWNIILQKKRTLRPGALETERFLWLAGSGLTPRASQGQSVDGAQDDETQHSSPFTHDSLALDTPVSSSQDEEDDQGEYDYEYEYEDEDEQEDEDQSEEGRWPDGED